MRFFMSLSPATSQNPRSRRIRLPAAPRRRPGERLIEVILFGCGFLSVLITVAIIAILAAGTVRFVMSTEFSLSSFLFGSDQHSEVILLNYGIASLLAGTLLVALIAAAVALPLGLTSA